LMGIGVQSHFLASSGSTNLESLISSMLQVPGGNWETCWGLHLMKAGMDRAQEMQMRTVHPVNHVWLDKSGGVYVDDIILR
jgi:hypothetical protein